MNWVNEVYQKCKDKENDRRVLDFLYKNFTEHLRDSNPNNPEQIHKLNQIDEMFYFLDPTLLSTTVQIGFLTISYRISDKLNYRKIFFDKVKELNKDRPKLWAGLE